MNRLYNGFQYTLMRSIAAIARLKSILTGKKGIFEYVSWKKNKRRKVGINAAIGTIFTVIGVIIAFLGYRSSVEGNRNSVLIEKPAINLNVSYADEGNRYIDKVAVEVTGQAASKVKIDVEPYLNVIFYLPNERSMVRKILPIWDLEKVEPLL
ncbi:MAG: hypothetical protein K2N78_00955, partial [Oscillospiraceae bacterium]|nr:hypothetical protein [Oscillospiraceae bacterium]